MENECKKCGSLAPDAGDLCSKCASDGIAESGNPFTSEPLFQKNILVTGAIVIAFSTAIIVVIGAIAGAAFNTSFSAALLPWSSQTLPQVNPSIPMPTIPVLPEPSSSASATESPTQNDMPTPSATDGENNTAQNTVALSQSQIDEGFKESDTGGIAWRWLTAAERAEVTCDASVAGCGWVKVVALRDCKGVIANADLSSTASQDDKLDTMLIGYGNNSLNDTSMAAGQVGTIELDTYTKHPQTQTYVFLTSLRCEDTGIAVG